MDPVFPVLELRRFEPDAGGEIPLPPGARRRHGTTRLVPAGTPPHPVRGELEPRARNGPARVEVHPEHVVTISAREVRVHDRATGALRVHVLLDGELDTGAADPAARRLFLVGSRVSEEELDGIGRADVHRPASAILDLETGEARALLPDPRGWVRSIHVHPDGTYLLLAGGDGPVRVLTLPGGEELGQVRLSLPIDTVDFSADGSAVVVTGSGNPDPTAELSSQTPWEHETGTWSLPSLEGEIATRPYRPSDRVPREEPGADLAALRLELGLAVGVPRVGGRRMAFSPCGRWLATPDHLVDREDGRVRDLPADLPGWERIRGLFWEAGEPPLLTRAYDRTYRELCDAALRRRDPDHAEEFDEDLIDLSADGRYRALDAGRGRLVLESPGERIELDLREEFHEIRAAAWTRDGARLAVAGRGRGVGEGVLALPGAPGTRPELLPCPGPDGPRCLEFSADGRWLFGGFEDGALRAWDLRAGARRAPVLGDPGPVLALAASPDGEVLAAAYRGGSVIEWDLAELLGRAAPG